MAAILISVTMFVPAVLGMGIAMFGNEKKTA